MTDGNKTSPLKEQIVSTDADIVQAVVSPLRTGAAENVAAKIDQIIRDLDGATDDPLYQVTCLQLIADLGESKEALEILEAKQVPAKLIALLNKHDPLVIPHALKLFYRISPLRLEINYPQVLDKICDYLKSEDRQLMDYAVDFVSYIASGGYLCRQVLNRLPDFKHKCLPQLGSTIISSDPLIKTRVLQCLRELFAIGPDDPKEETSLLSNEFYHQTLPGAIRMTTQLLALCRIPIMEIRISAMQVVAAVAREAWAQAELAAHPNFSKWIVDRSSEACKEGKEAKFEILKAIVESKIATRAFKGEDYLKMRADFKMGPYHVGIAEEMLMDNQQAS